MFAPTLSHASVDKICLKVKSYTIILSLPVKSLNTVIELNHNPKKFCENFNLVNSIWRQSNPLLKLLLNSLSFQRIRNILDSVACTGFLKKEKIGKDEESTYRTEKYELTKNEMESHIFLQIMTSQKISKMGLSLAE